LWQYNTFRAVRLPSEDLLRKPEGAEMLSGKLDFRPEGAKTGEPRATLWGTRGNPKNLFKSPVRATQTAVLSEFVSPLQGE
jgi:hypothetical protein